MRISIVPVAVLGAHAGVGTTARNALRRRPGSVILTIVTADNQRPIAPLKNARTRAAKHGGVRERFRRNRHFGYAAFQAVSARLESVADSRA